LFTSVGAPQIWNGEEMGMWGGDDPDCRKPLWWPAYRFSPETRTNYQPVPKLYDSVGFNAAQHQWYKKLTALRREHEVLRRGEIAFEYAEGQQLMYRRYLGSQQLWVVLNASNTVTSISLPAGQYTDLLTGATIKADAAALPALSGWVLQKQ
jgi:glycosidase